MRRPEGASAKLWIGDIHRLFGIEPRVIQEYWSTEHRIVRPSIEASKPGGRNVYLPRDVVKLLTAKQLAESGMKLEEVGKVIHWMGNKMVLPLRYPDDLRELRTYTDTGEFSWTSGNPRGEREGWWESVNFDPFPRPEVAAAYYGKKRGYPPMPETATDWLRYWRGLAQFVLIDRYRRSLSSVHVLVCLRWLYAPPGQFTRIRRWYHEVISDLALEPVLQKGHEALSNIRLLDVGAIKRRVAGRLLIPRDNW